MKKRDLNNFVSVCRDIFLKETNDYQTQQFLREASDYEIVHLAIKGTFPNKYSKKLEIQLIEQITNLQEIQSNNNRKISKKKLYLNHMIDTVHNFRNDISKHIVHHHLHDPGHNLLHSIDHGIHHDMNHVMMLAGGVATGIASIVGAHKLYKEFVEKNLPKSVFDKHGLIVSKLIRQKGKALQMTFLKNSIFKCLRTKNPNACKRIIYNKIQQISKKI